MGGSAAQFIDAIDAVGAASQSRRRRYIKILKPVQVEHGRSRAEFRPAARGFHLDVEIDFEDAAIGRQRRAFDVGPEVFRREIGRARTFGFVADVKKLWQSGFALGSSLENSVAIDGEAILNPEGLRYGDEFVRHKALDAIGDLSLAGAAIVGAYHVYRPGHTINALALSELFADRRSYEIIEAAPRRFRAGTAAQIGRAATAWAANAD
jgi:UDP-3-O-[3-hydroxymyristoyl] N-acetylglucosamine deacetylase